MLDRWWTSAMTAPDIVPGWWSCSRLPLPSWGSSWSVSHDSGGGTVPLVSVSGAAVEAATSGCGW